jgi:pimeloyl-ACP methyl ester carboxylesterase
VPNRQPIVRLLAASGVLAAVLTLVTLSFAQSPVAPKYLELGKGPTIIFVHDLGSGRMVWMPTARKLVGRYHVVMVDLPGHGDSPLPSPFTLDAAAGSLGEVIGKWNPDSTVVVGEGMGGMLSLMALKSRPHAVRGLALVDCGLKSPIKIDDQERQDFMRMMDANYDRMLRMFFMDLGRDSAQGKVIHATAAQVPPNTIKTFIGAVLTADASASLKALTVPYMFIGTDYLDKAMKQSNARTLNLLLRSWGYEDTLSVPMRRVKNAGFLIMQDQPDTLAAVVSEFAGRVLAKK